MKRLGRFLIKARPAARACEGLLALTAYVTDYIGRAWKTGGIGRVAFAVPVLHAL